MSKLSTIETRLAEHMKGPHDIKNVRAWVAKKFRLEAQLRRAKKGKRRRRA